MKRKQLHKLSDCCPEGGVELLGAIKETLQSAKESYRQEIVSMFQKEIERIEGNFGKETDITMYLKDLLISELLLTKKDVGKDISICGHVTCNASHDGKPHTKAQCSNSIECCHKEPKELSYDERMSERHKPKETRPFLCNRCEVPVYKETCTCPERQTDGSWIKKSKDKGDD